MSSVPPVCHAVAVGWLVGWDLPGEVWQDGTRYAGQWFHDVPHGQGKLEQVRFGLTTWSQETREEKPYGKNRIICMVFQLYI